MTLYVLFNESFTMVHIANIKRFMRCMRN